MLLERPAEWPKGYRWDFSTGGRLNGWRTGCAYCLHHRVWGRDMREASGTADAHNEMLMYGHLDPLITPDVVAGRIRDHLAGRPIRYLVAGDRG